MMIQGQMRHKCSAFLTGATRYTTDSRSLALGRYVLNVGSVLACVVTPGSGCGLITAAGTRWKQLRLSGAHEKKNTRKMVSCRGLMLLQ